jgi:ubiquinone/menaquinone biosynthesis C-methylase UbiE
MTQTQTYPAEKAHRLDSKLRRLLQNPYIILRPFVSKGMTVLDYGCGNGYFSIPISELVGNTGKVYSIDIQEEMLQKLSTKLTDLNITNVTPVLKGNEKLGFRILFDFVVAVYVVHEIQDQKAFFEEMFDLLKPNGKMLIVEPDIIVSKRKFNKTLDLAKQIGFVECEQLNIFFSKSRILMK